MEQKKNDPSYLARVARNINRERSLSREKVNLHRKRMMAKDRIQRQNKTMEQPIPYVTNNQNLATVSYIGGKRSVTLTRELISLLLSNKLINAKTATLLFLLMEYGADEMCSGLTVFDKPGEFAKFALAYDLDAEEALRHLVSLKACKTPLENLVLQLHLDLVFPGD